MNRSKKEDSIERILTAADVDWKDVSSVCEFVYTVLVTTVISGTVIASMIIAAIHNTLMLYVNTSIAAAVIVLYVIPRFIVAINKKNK